MHCNIFNTIRVHTLYTDLLCETDLLIFGFFLFLSKPLFQTRLRSGIRTRTRHFAARRDQPRHTRARVQDRGRRRAAARARPSAIPGTGHQDRRVPGRETRAIPRGQAVPGAHREESPGAGGQTVPGARVQDQAHLPRAQVEQMAQRLVKTAR